MKRLYDAASAVLLILIGQAVIAAYPALPGRIPTHFDIAGRPNQWSSKSALIWLLALALGMTALFYILAALLPKFSRRPEFLNIPHKAEFLKLAKDRQLVYWRFTQEFLTGIAAALNLLWYALIRGMLSVARGEATLLPFRSVFPGLAAIGLLMILYLPRLYTLPKKLIRGEEP